MEKLSTVFEFSLTRTDGRRNVSAIAILETISKRIATGESKRMEVTATEDGLIRICEFIE